MLRGLMCVLSTLESWVRIPLEAEMCICFFSVLCCPVWVEVLRWADPLPKDFYKMSIRFVVSQVTSELKQARRSNP
jgi:hypothetical protein